MLDADILTDGTVLEATHPRLKVGVHPEHYEWNMVMGLFVTALSGLIGLIGITMLIIGLVRVSRNYGRNALA